MHSANNVVASLTQDEGEVSQQDTQPPLQSQDETAAQEATQDQTQDQSQEQTSAPDQAQVQSSEQQAQEPPQQEEQQGDGDQKAEGDGEEDAVGQQQEGEEEDDENLIPADFYYDYEEHVSRPAVTEDSGLPSDMLTLLYPLFNNILVLFYA